jgi:hypothetical protein
VLIGAAVLLGIALLGVVAVLVSGAANRGPLGKAIGASVALLMTTVALYGIALLIAHGAECPGRGYEPTGLDKPISPWPPGAECSPSTSPGTHHGLAIEEPIPWLKWAIVWFGLGAPVVLMTGIVAEIRDRRVRSRANDSSRLIPT